MLPFFAYFLQGQSPLHSNFKLERFYNGWTNEIFSVSKMEKTVSEMKAFLRFRNNGWGLDEWWKMIGVCLHQK